MNKIYVSLSFTLIFNFLGFTIFSGCNGHESRDSGKILMVEEIDPSESEVEEVGPEEIVDPVHNPWQVIPTSPDDNGIHPIFQMGLAQGPHLHQVRLPTHPRLLLTIRPSHRPTLLRGRPRQHNHRIQRLFLRGSTYGPALPHSDGSAGIPP